MTEKGCFSFIDMLALLIQSYNIFTHFSYNFLKSCWHISVCNGLGCALDTGAGIRFPNTGDK